MSNSIDVVVTLRDGSQKTFSSPAGNSDVDMATLQKSLLMLRDQTNELLTEMVNNEKAAAVVKGSDAGSKTTGNDEEDEDDEEDDEDDASKNEKTQSSPESEPPSKRHKT